MAPVFQQAQMTKREIEELLRKGAYGALMEDDSAGDAFCEEDIDQILQRRTQVIQIESEGKGSTFAKVSLDLTEKNTSHTDRIRGQGINICQGKSRSYREEHKSYR